MSTFATLIGYAAWISLTVAELELPEQFQSVLERRDSIETLTARFHQETIAPEELIESDGSLVYINPKRILFRYDDPPLTYMIDAKRSYEYDEEMEQLLVYDLDGGPEAEAFFLGFENNTSKVMEAYAITIEPATDSTKHVFTVVLTPKEQDEENLIFERVYLNIDRDHFMPSQITIINDEENKVVFHIDEFEINTSLDPKLPRLSVPEGTDIIINDESVGQAGPEGQSYPEPESVSTAGSNAVDRSSLVQSESLEKASNP
jgi:outer membrane lipoprotein-sorting protein